MKKNVFMCLAAMALLVSCSKSEVGPASDDVAVELSGVINTDASTRAGENEGVKESNNDLLPKSLLYLSVFRADATSGTSYGNVYTNAAAIDGTFDVTGQIAMDPLQYYLIDETKSSKFIAVHPRIDAADYSTKYTAAARTVEYEIDGNSDIIASTVVEGNKSNPIGTYMVFSHLLTQVQVKVVADAASTSADWGKLTEISINGKAVTALVTLPDPSTAGQAVINYKEGSGALPLVSEYSTDGLDIPTGDAVLFGYAMFLPSEDESLTFNITTARGGTGKTVTTTAIDWDASNAYEIVIEFQANGNAIVQPGKTGQDAAKLNQWNPVLNQPVSIQ
jgi:hypothetical protein